MTDGPRPRYQRCPAGDGFPLGTAGMTERGTLGFFQRVTSIFPEEQRTGLSWGSNRVSDVWYQGKSGKLWGQPPAWVFCVSLILGLSIDCGTSQISLESAVRWPDCHKSFTLKRRSLQNFPFSVIFRPALRFLAALGMTGCRNGIMVGMTSRRNDRMQRSRKRVDHG